MNLSIQPFGHINDDVIKTLRERLSPYFERITVLKELPVPEEAYDPYLEQYKAEVFMDVLKDVKGKKVLGVVDRDLCATGFNFVFGKSRINGKQCVIGLERLRDGVTRAWFLDRVHKEALHELGHTWGLKHCGDITCVMHFSDRLSDTDIKSKGFCRKCRKTLKK